MEPGFFGLQINVARRSFSVHPLQFKDADLTRPPKLLTPRDNLLLRLVIGSVSKVRWDLRGFFLKIQPVYI
jgi:hypothetical protein